MYDLKKVNQDMGEHLRNLREQAGLSQEDIGNPIGISYQQVQKYEKGTNRISFPRLVQYAAVLQCPIIDLIPEQYR